MNNLSVFSSKLLVFKYALQIIYSTETPNKNKVIFSDSLSSLKAIKTNNSARQDLVQAIQILYNKLTINGFNIIHECLPAHVGIQGNEIADVYANKSLQNPTIDVNIKFNVHEILSQVIPKLVKQWDYEYKYFGKPWHLEIKF